jgi:thioredoxin reductase
MQAEVAIIGAGPAGLAAAIQLRRYRIPATVYERAEAGGLLRNANLVENYPGFPDGIPGQAMAGLVSAQAEHAGVEITFEEVLDLAYEDCKFHLRTPNSTRRFPIVIVASGTSPRALPGLEIPERLRPRFSYEVHPLLHVTGKRIGIIGAGDAAFDYALNLSKANEIIILNHGESPSCLPLLWERAIINPHIQYRKNYMVKTVCEGRTSEFVLKCEDPGGNAGLAVDYLIAAIGRDPETSFISASVWENCEDLEKKGFLYFIGDVKNGIYRQSSIAVGEGVLTAMKIYQRIKETG